MRTNRKDRIEAPQMEEGAEDLLQLQAAALEAAANPIVISRCDGTMVWVNKAFELLSGYSRGEVLGQNTRLLKSDQQPVSFYKDMWNAILAGQKWRGELINRRKDGTLYPEEMTITPVASVDGQITHFIAIKLDITERKAAEEQIRHMALVDPLTGLANYRQLVVAMDSEIKRFGRSERPFAILLLDLDELKLINDTHGHQVGSHALGRVANTLREHSRAIDTPARYGGDEFAVVLPETNAEGALMLGKRISERLKNDGEKPLLSISVGVAVCPQDGKSIEELMATADRSLYRDKRLSKKSPAVSRS